MSFAKILAQVLVQGTAVFGAFRRRTRTRRPTRKNVAKGAKEAVRQRDAPRRGAGILGVTQGCGSTIGKRSRRGTKSFSRPTAGQGRLLPAEQNLPRKVFGHGRGGAGGCRGGGSKEEEEEGERQARG